MILFLISVGVLAFLFRSELMLELAAGSALLVLPLSLIDGAWEVFLTAVVLLIVSVFVMALHPHDA